MVIVAAHPDDEVIGIGGQLGRLIVQSAVFVVTVTDGVPCDGADARSKGFGTLQDYAMARRAELDAALACLPRPVHVMRLGFDDQQLVYQLAQVIDQLAQLVSAVTPDVVITHCYEGGHPDHDALAVAISVIARNTDLRPFCHLEFAGYHGDAFGQLVTGRFPPEPRCEALRTVLTPAERTLKRRMLSCFRTQQNTLAPFGCDEEWIRRAPAYDFMTAPNSGHVWYDRYHWRVPRDEWRAHVQALFQEASGSMTC